MTQQAPTERSIFLEAIEKHSEAERAWYVEQACRGDSQLCAKVNALLRAHQESGDLLDAPDALPPTTDQPVTEDVGNPIGRYKLLEQVGEGGMGVVFVAEQTEPIRRRVALKVIKPGMDTKQVIARFEAERQALAMMDHPNIARVLDAGTTEAGRPYFVMELVRGMPITEYCDKARLGPRGRLELFVDVCQAVQHAHQKGIIHRDLKPSNVLITLHDGTPVVKVSLQGHTSDVWNVAFSPDGQRLASFGGGEVRVWDAQTGQQLLVLKGQGWSLTFSLAFSRDGHWLVADRRLWDATPLPEEPQAKDKAP